MRDTDIFMYFTKIVELSNNIENGMPYYPGDPEPRVEIFKSIVKDGVNIRKLQMGTHTGTHVDAPAHFLKDGKHLDELDALSYSGEGTVINVDGREEIMASDVPENIKNKIVLFYTGTSKNWKKGWNMKTFSYLSVPAAQALVRYGAKAVGIDSPSVESPASDGTVHRTLLGNNVLIIENISQNLKDLTGLKFYLFCLPIKVKDGDGAPARVIGVIE